MEVGSQPTFDTGLEQRLNMFRKKIGKRSDLNKSLEQFGKSLENVWKGSDHPKNAEAQVERRRRLRSRFRMETEEEMKMEVSRNESGG